MNEKSQKTKRPFWKEDDGKADLIVKVATFAAIFLAVHQYYYKVYPVWSKQHELNEAKSALVEAGQAMQQVERQKLALQADISSLSKEKTAIENQLSSLRERERELEKEVDTLSESHEKAIANLLDEARQERDRLLKEKGALQLGLHRAKESSEKLLVETLSAHLERFASEIFRKKLDAILTSKVDMLDLKRDALAYVEQQRGTVRTRSERVALDILKVYATTKIPDDSKKYTSILGVYIEFQYEDYAQPYIEQLKNQQP